MSINLNATSFYWSYNLRKRYEEEGIHLDILDKNRELDRTIRKIEADVDLTQRQKAKEISKVIETFADGQMDVIFAILDTKFGIVADIFGEETPFELTYRGKELRLELGSIDEYTNVIYIGKDNQFIPLSQYTTVEDFNDVLDGKVEYEDIVDNWMILNESEDFENLSITTVASNGWRPMECFREHPTWYKSLSADFSKLYNAYEQQELAQKFLDDHRISAHEDGLLMSDEDEDFMIDEFEEAMADAIVEIPEYLGYFGLQEWFKLLVTKTNERQKDIKYHFYKWIGYSQGDSGYVMYRVNLEEVPDFYDFVDNSVKYQAAIAKGDSYFKHVIKTND